MTDGLSTAGGRVCPVCGHTPVHRDVELYDYSLFRCGQCECWSSNAATTGAATSFVPETYFKNTERDRGKWEVLRRKCGEADKAPASVLDVGCGTGQYLRFVREWLPKADIEGIEIDGERAAEAKRHNPHARIHMGDADAVVSRIEKRFDLVTLWDVFEHVPAPTHLLTKLTTVLAPGGWIYIQTIHEHSFVPTLGRLVYRLSGQRIQYPVRRTHEPHHLVFFSLRGLEIAAKHAGLVVRDRWFDRLARHRMDGPGLLTLAASIAFGVENMLGNGLFVNVLFEQRRDRV